ncbi:hypothetical protein [Mesorhizobium sp. CAU 1741]|uniref:hypothetical protein n=1 Tax=Mesorhizobium sp. CAU 1741 TaxID=3140366 RepID=UPI00325A8A3E
MSVQIAPISALRRATVCFGETRGAEMDDRYNVEECEVIRDDKLDISALLVPTNATTRDSLQASSNLSTACG